MNFFGNLRERVGQYISIGLRLTNWLVKTSTVNVFPLLSVTVNVIFGFKLEQSKTLGLTLIEAIPQESVDPLSIWLAETLTVPLTGSKFRARVSGAMQFAIGFSLSSTVTIAVQISEFPFWSSTVNVTVFIPISEQSKEFGETLIKLTPPQSSLDPLLISIGLMLAIPFTSWTVIFWQDAVGGVVSFILKMWLTSVELPHASVIVYVLVMVPF